LADLPKQSSLSDPQKVISQLFPRSGFVRRGEKVAGGGFTLRQGKTARLLSLILFSFHFHDCPAKGGKSEDYLQKSSCWSVIGTVLE
jgi:hypothetical protein